MALGNPEGHVLEKAHVFCYRLFDVAGEIDLDLAQSLLALDTGPRKLAATGTVAPTPYAQGKDEQES